MTATNPADIARALSEAPRIFTSGQPMEITAHWGTARVRLHRPTPDASTDRNQATVVRCGKEIE